MKALGYIRVSTEKQAGEVIGSMPYGYRREGDKLTPERTEAGTIGINKHKPFMLKARD